MVGSPIKMSDTQPVYNAVPLLGEHTPSVLAELLNYDDEKLAKLRQNKVI